MAGLPVGWRVYIEVTDISKGHVMFNNMFIPTAHFNILLTNSFLQNLNVAGQPQPT